MDDSVLDDIEREDNKETETPIAIINTNARSLCPKINSFIDCFDEMGAMIGIVTETWLSEGDHLEKDIVDLKYGAGIGLICKNRLPNDRGVAHGGVAIAYRTSSCRTSELALPNPDGHEVLCTVTSMPGYTRQLVTIACYMPPGLTVPAARACVRHVEDIIIEIRRRYKEPLILLGGDFNQWKIEEAVEDFADMREANVGFTRKEKCIDRLFTNFDRAQRSSGTVPPLDVEPGQPGTASDHRVSYIKAVLPKVRKFEWMSYRYRYNIEDSAKQFGAWLSTYDWGAQAALVGSNAKAEHYQEAVTSAMERFFLSLLSGGRRPTCLGLTKT